MSSVLSNPDAGARVIAPHIALSETQGPAYVTTAVPVPGGIALGFGDRSIAWLADGANAQALRIVATLHGTPIAGTADAASGGALFATDAGTLEQVCANGECTLIAREAEGWIEHLAVHPGSGTRAYAAGRDAIVLGAHGDVRHRLSAHPSTVAGLAFSRDGTRLAAAHYGGVSVWDLTATTPASTRLEWHGSHTGVAWSPDDRFVVSAMQDKELHCWRMPEQAGMRMGGYPSKIRSMSWSADGCYLAVSGAESVTCWNFEGKGPRGKAPAEFGYVYNAIVVQVAAHPRERMVAGGFDDGSVLIGTIGQDSAAIARPGNGSAVSALCWAADGQAIVFGTQSGEVGVCRVGG